MRSRSKFALTSLLSVLCTAAPLRAAVPPDEEALARLWQAHVQAPANHTELIRACVAFEKQHLQSPLRAVSHGLLAWHLLAAGQPAAAEQVLRKQLSEADGRPLTEQAAEQARRWLTRLDREKVRAALRAYYADHIDYPPTLAALAALPEAQRPPAADQWQAPWRYQPADFRQLKNFSGQRYLLESTALKADSDLRAALAVPYSGRTNVVPLRVVSGVGERRTALFRIDGVETLLSEGTQQGGLGFAHLGSALLVLSDGDRWTLLPLPRAP